MKKWYLISKKYSIALAFMLTLYFGASAEAATGTWLTPAQGSTVTSRFVEVSVGYNTESDVKITASEVFINGTSVERRSFASPQGRGVISYNWDTWKYKVGTHRITVKLYSGDKEFIVVQGYVSVGNVDKSNKVPIVSFGNLKDNQVLSGETNISLNIANDNASPAMVSLLVDGKIRMLSNVRPFSYELDTTTYTDGNHIIHAYASDPTGKAGPEAKVTVVFKNGNSEQTLQTTANITQNAPIQTEQNTAKNEVVVPSYNNVIDTTPARTAAPLETEPIQKAVPVAEKQMAPAISDTVKSIETAPELNSDATILAMLPKIDDAIISNASEPIKPEETIAEETHLSAIANESAISETVKNIEIKPKISELNNIAENEAKSQLQSMKTAEPTQYAVDTPEVITELSIDDIMAYVPEYNVQDKYKLSSANSSIPSMTALRPEDQDKILDIKSPDAKVFLRDMLNGTGAVLMWNNKEKIVTAIFSDKTTVAMKIGSKMINVNGNRIEIESAPEIVDGRTVIKAKIFENIMEAVAKAGDLKAEAR
ncbi:MAG: stalk domain-containing protein [Armatimonadota bacterium]